jgi:hypothetical protein
MMILGGTVTLDVNLTLSTIPPFFDYFPPVGGFASDLFVCSSAEDQHCGLTTGTNSFFVQIPGFPSTPTFFDSAYAQSSVPGEYHVYWLCISCPRPHRRCRPARPDLGRRWPSRLVATAAEDRLKARSNET